MRGLIFADLNNDLRVDGLDQAIMLEAFGTNNFLADLNLDGIVDAADLQILLANWSDYSDDVIETSDASSDVGPNGRLLVSGVESPAVSRVDSSGNLYSQEQYVEEIAKAGPFFNTANLVIGAVMTQDPIDKSLPLLRQGPYTIPFQDWQRST